MLPWIIVCEGTEVRTISLSKLQDTWPLLFVKILILVQFVRLFRWSPLGKIADMRVVHCYILVQLGLILLFVEPNCFWTSLPMKGGLNSVVVGYFYSWNRSHSLRISLSWVNLHLICQLEYWWAWNDWLLTKSGRTGCKSASHWVNFVLFLVMPIVFESSFLPSHLGLSYLGLMITNNWNCQRPKCRRKWIEPLNMAPLLACVTSTSSTD